MLQHGEGAFDLVESSAKVRLFGSRASRQSGLTCPSGSMSSAISGKVKPEIFSRSIRATCCTVPAR
ncbi:MAG: hypothetical protein R2713_14885 [Ilumatobacteraceae bacterium]